MANFIIPTNEQENELAQEALWLVVNALLKRNKKIIAGTEIEHYILGVNPDDDMPVTPEGIRWELKRARKLSPNLERENTRLGFQKYRVLDSIADIYKETRANKYELVLNPHELRRIVARTKAAKKVIGKTVLDNYDGIAKSVHFSAVGNHTTPSLHITSSILDALTGAAILDVDRSRFKTNKDYEAYLGSMESLAFLVANLMKPLLHETMALQAPNPSSYDRYNLRKDESSRPGIIGVAVQKKTSEGISIRYDEEHYKVKVENRLPGDADPLFAVLVTAMAIYIALEKNNFMDIPDKKIILPEDLPIPSRLSEAADIFGKGNLFRETLNKLSEGDLGDRLHNAITMKYKLYMKDILAIESGYKFHQ